MACRATSSRANPCTRLARDDRHAHEDLDASSLLPLAGDMIFDAISVVGGRLSYIACRDELVGHYERQDLEPHTCDEERGPHKLKKPLLRRSPSSPVASSAPHG